MEHPTERTNVHPSTENLMKWLEPNPNLPGLGRDIAGACHELAKVVVEVAPEGPELSAGLRKLLEAKDCFVRATLP
jgi:hypothetical protein